MDPLELIRDNVVKFCGDVLASFECPEDQHRIAEERQRLLARIDVEFCYKPNKIFKKSNPDPETKLAMVGLFNRFHKSVLICFFHLRSRKSSYCQSKTETTVKDSGVIFKTV